MEKGGGKIKELAITMNLMSENDLIEFAKKFGTGLRRGDLIFLEGELGSGKTTFVKGLALSIDIDMNMVSSPTFTILNIYSGKLKIYHMDLYRLNNIDEFIEAGLEEFLYPKDGVTIIEWPGIIESTWKDGFLKVKIEFIDNMMRKLMITFKGKNYEKRFLRGDFYENIKNR
ncbi:MAG: tRNA threonylcarbamoyladenosine biosynthesis protein TsaE [Thermotogaceae bacterium]|nr:tRNA threonylcarbamoyladenosine biosynthesis protein TsaE [Thermotogaceae bacterium]MDN5337331.1 tRNA threonylcarbamoyladenosine biosynthesis protein TsaE [Thermotogaceae bacterium]